MSSVASKTSYLTHCTFNSCTRHLKLLSHRNREVPHFHSGILTLFIPPFPLSVFPSKKVQTSLPPPLGNDWWSSQLTRYSSHTKHSDYSFSLTVIKQPEEKKCASAHSHQKILIAYSRPIINILSAHAHGKGLGATQKVWYQCMSPGNPKHHTPRLLCRSYMIY